MILYHDNCTCLISLPLVRSADCGTKTCKFGHEFILRSLLRRVAACRCEDRCYPGRRGRWDLLASNFGP